MALAMTLQDGNDPVVPLRSVGDAGIEPTTPQQQSLSPSSHKRVLVAEDDLDLLDSLRLILESEGYEVSVASDGRQALTQLRADPGDVLVLDLHMPEVDGIGVLSDLGGPPPVVIIHSAFEYYDPDEVQRTLGTRVFRALRKPVPPHQLIAAVAEAIRSLDGD